MKRLTLTLPLFAIVALAGCQLYEDGSYRHPAANVRGCMFPALGCDGSTPEPIDPSLPLGCYRGDLDGDGHISRWEQGEPETCEVIQTPTLSQPLPEVAP